MENTKFYEVRVWHKANTYGGLFKEGETWTDYIFHNEEAAKMFRDSKRAQGFKAGMREL